MRVKKGIHPDYKQAKVVCTTCGNEFEIGSIREEMRIDTCSNCHPFYTGETKLMKTGAMEKFYARKKKMEAINKAK